MTASVEKVRNLNITVEMLGFHLLGRLTAAYPSPSNWTVPSVSAGCGLHTHARARFRPDDMEVLCDIMSCLLDACLSSPDHTTSTISISLSVVPQADGFPVQRCFSHTAWECGGLHSICFLQTSSSRTVVKCTTHIREPEAVRVLLSHYTELFLLKKVTFLRQDKFHPETQMSLRYWDLFTENIFHRI